MRARRAPRSPRDPEAERARIEERTVEHWEEADLRDQAEGAAARASSGWAPAPKRRTAPVDAEVVAEINAAAPDRRVAERAVERLAHAQDALERDRLDEARRAATQLLRSVPGVPAAHELAGLVAYRQGRWRDAVRELETARVLRPNVALLPVLADSYRALRRWADVERIWSEVRSISPAHEVLAEARIVAAGALADRGDLSAALRTMGDVPASPKRVREHHLRMWYVLGDLHDRAGNTLEAARWFERVARHDDEYVDVSARLRALGRQ